MYRIMVVEDDEKIASIVSSHLKKYGYEVVRVTEFSDLKAKVIEESPDLILLDINLPKYDGFYWCRQIRTISTAPVIFISARAGEMDQVMAIENGGDDYLVKPFSLDVMRAKVKSALRRAYGEYAEAGVNLNVRELAGLFWDKDRNTVEWKGTRITLTPTEFRLLATLVEQAGRIVGRAELLESIWDDVHFVEDNTLTVNINRLRKKLASLNIPNPIETVRGQGYRLTVTWRDKDETD